MPPGDPRTHTDGIIVHLAAELPGWVAIGRAEVPGIIPHVIVYPVTGGNTDGSIGDPDVDLVFPFRLTCVSLNSEQAQWLQNAARSAMLSQEVAVSGRSTYRLWVESPSGLMRDDTLGEQAGGVRFYTSDLFHLKTVPA